MDSPTTSTINRPVIISKGGGFISELIKNVSEFIPNLLDLAFGLGTTVWIYYLIKIPWGLYFKARKGRIDGQESRENGIEQDEDTIRKLRDIENKLLVASLSAHVFSALGVYGISYLTGGRWIRPHTALLFLGSAILRPAWEFHFHIRARIEQLIKRIQYPKAYVEKLLQDVDVLKRNEKTNEDDRKAVQVQLQTNIDNLRSKEERDINDLAERLKFDVKRILEKEGQDVKQLHDQITILQNKLVELEVNVKKNSEKTLIYFEKIEAEFSDALTKLSADKKMIEGVRSFMQLVRENLISK